MAEAAALEEFLAAAGWAAAARRPLAGDASGRRYLRLDGGAVLMIATPAEVAPFLRIAAHLSGLGLSAPKLLAADAPRGLLLLEDLGDALFARLAEADPGQADLLYPAAADLLAELQRHPPPPGLPVWGGDLPGAQAALAAEAWAGRPEVAAELAAAVSEACARLAGGAGVLILRDFHAENLIWLPQRQGLARVGLLDFQDAMAGPPAYDLVSLLRDARRDVAPELATRVTARFRRAIGAAPEPFAAAAAAVGAARQLRILGVFARLARRGRRGYLRHMPRVWAHLQADLAHPELQALRGLVARHVPAPTPARLEALR